MSEHDRPWRDKNRRRKGRPKSRDAHIFHQLKRRVEEVHRRKPETPMAPDPIAP